MLQKPISHEKMLSHEEIPREEIPDEKMLTTTNPISSVPLYRNYKKEKVEWLALFNALEKSKTDGTSTTLTEIARQYNVTLPTLSRRYNKWINSGRNNVGTTDNRGGPNRVLT